MEQLPLWVTPQRALASQRARAEADERRSGGGLAFIQGVPGIGRLPGIGVPRLGISLPNLPVPDLGGVTDALGRGFRAQPLPLDRPLFKAGPDGLLHKGTAAAWDLIKPGPDGLLYKATEPVFNGIRRVAAWGGGILHAGGDALTERLRNMPGIGERAMAGVRLFGRATRALAIAELIATEERYGRGAATEAEYARAWAGVTPLGWVNDADAMAEDITILLGLKKMARGGRVRHGEITLVGERGPEIVQLPAGSNVIPAHRSREALERSVSAVPAGVAGGRRELHVIQQLDGREIARSTIRNLDDDEQWGRR